MCVLVCLPLGPFRRCVVLLDDGRVEKVMTSWRPEDGALVYIATDLGLFIPSASKSKNLE